MTFKLALVLAILLQIGLSMPGPDSNAHVEVNVNAKVNGGSGCCDKKHDNICMFQMDWGYCPIEHPLEPCLGDDRFYFDIDLGFCIPFRYLGEGGNANRFSTYEECMMKCRTIDCPAGYFVVKGSSQCYKFIKEKMSWTMAVKKCSELHPHSTLANPNNPVEVANYLVKEYDLQAGDWTYLGGKGNGTGTVMLWQYNNEVIPYPKYWYSSYTTTIGFVTLLMSDPGSTANGHQNLLYSQDDTSNTDYVLCEFIYYN